MNQGKDRKIVDFSKIKCIAYDFDGVMTDNRVLVTEDGTEAVFCNRSDGLAISLFKKAGVHQVIISTEKNHVVEARAKKIGIDVVHGVEDKGRVLVTYCGEMSLDSNSVLFIGNDLNDIPAYEVAGYKGCPRDAERTILSMCDWISNKNGGYGVIRDLYNVYQKCLKDRGEE